MSGDNPWIEWSGGECPVDLGEPVVVKFRDGDLGEHARAGDWEPHWPHDANYPDDDIIAYRVVKP